MPSFRSLYLQVTYGIIVTTFLLTERTTEASSKKQGDFALLRSQSMREPQRSDTITQHVSHASVRVPWTLLLSRKDKLERTAKDFGHTVVTVQDARKVLEGHRRFANSIRSQSSSETVVQKSSVSKS